MLERLVVLNQARAAEERAGVVRWLRPELQRKEVSADLGLTPTEVVAEVSNKPRPWPATLPERIGAVRAALPRGLNVDVETVARGFHRANRRDVEVILESLGAIGLVVTLGGPEGRRWRAG